MELHREIRFYTCLALGYILLCWGFNTPPEGEISRTVLIASGVLFCMGALAVGIDLKGCIAEIRKCIESAHNSLKEAKQTTNEEK